ncbi:hypothetical protein [Novosphingobium terrae]|uniref:hypothetical protein n=1 Tax=Novosphingobium terrae TaxID=2726189 RepID=UPI00197EB932|nr:hypothetical protein [Novosphingobium terrae]
MNTSATEGRWAATTLRRCGCDWPYDWVSDVTSYDPVNGVHQLVARIQQSAVRAYPEATANVRAMALAREMAEVIELVAAVIEMSDPEHPAFVDSAADCLAALLERQGDVQRLRRALRAPLGADARPAATLKGHCHHD